MADPVNELTTATILFTDVVDSTTTRTMLGEEHADRVFARHSRLLRDIVRAHRTEFVKSVGDGVMAVFQSATNGLRAAAAIQRAVDAENSRSATALEVRGGLSSGDIVWTEDDIDGLPAVEAARLAAAAAGGQVLCSELTARLAFGREGLEFKDLGSITLKGLAHPLPTLEVLWWRQPTTSTPAPTWLDTDELLPFVGREPELALISQWLARTVDRPVVAVFEGDAGAGKTRLLAEVAAAAIGRGHVLVAGRCTDPPAGPFQPFAEAVTRLATTSPALLLAARDRGEPADLAELARLAPALARAPFELRPESASDPETEYFRLLAALATLVERLASTSPVALVIEDLHWATASTHRLLTGLLLLLEQTPLRVIVTLRGAGPGRNVLEAPFIGELLVRTDVTRIAVPPLTADDIAIALATDRLGGLVEVPVAESARIATISGGNAFLVTETIRELRSGRPVGGSAPPSETVRRFITSRVARVGPAAREIVQMTACAGRVELGALRIALAADDTEFVAAVDEAIATGVVVASDDGVLAVAHDLARAGVTSTITPARAALVHRNLVDALTAIEPDIAQSRPYLLAEHLFAIAWLGAPDDVRGARDAARSAAEHASSRLAHSEAVGWMERSIQCHDRLRDGSPALRAELGLELGQAKWRSGDHDARAVLGEAGRAAGAAGRPDLLIAAALAGSRGFFSATAALDEQAIGLLSDALDVVDPADLATRAELLAGLAAEMTWSPEGDRRFALSDEALELARRSGNDRALARVIGSRLLTVNAADTLDLRLAESEELFDLAKRLDDDLLRFHAAFQRAEPLFESGDMVGAFDRLQDARALAQSLRQPELCWLVEFGLAGTELMRGDLGGAEVLAGEALQIGLAAGRRREALAFYSEQIAEVRRLQGRLAELEGPMAAAADRLQLDPVHAVLRYLCEAGTPGVERHLERAVSSGFPPRRDIAQRPALDNLIFIAACLGRDDLLPVLYDALSPAADTFCHSAVAHPCGHHFLAVAAAALGDTETADRHFEAAMELHERAGAPLLLAESVIEWLRLIVPHGDAGRVAALRERASAALSDRDAPLLADRLAEVVR